MRDEILEDVQATKVTLAEQCGFDIRRIYEEIKKSEIQSAAEGWKHVMPVPLIDGGSIFQRTRFSAQKE